MVTRYGMSDQFGMVALETVNNPYLSSDTSMTCSPETARLVDEEVIRIVKQQYDKAMGILKANAGKLNEIAAYLLEKETITGEEFMEILNGGNTPEQKKNCPELENEVSSVENAQPVEKNFEE